MKMKDEPQDADEQSEHDCYNAGGAELPPDKPEVVKPETFRSPEREREESWAEWLTWHYYPEYWLPGHGATRPEELYDNSDFFDEPEHAEWWDECCKRGPVDRCRLCGELLPKNARGQYCQQCAPPPPADAE
jgi:hypothetical protein